MATRPSTAGSIDPKLMPSSYRILQYNSYLAPGVLYPNGTSVVAWLAGDQVPLITPATELTYWYDRYASFGTATAASTAPTYNSDLQGGPTSRVTFSGTENPYNFTITSNIYGNQTVWNDFEASLFLVAKFDSIATTQTMFEVYTGSTTAYRFGFDSDGNNFQFQSGSDTISCAFSNTTNYHLFSAVSIAGSQEIFIDTVSKQTGVATPTFTAPSNIAIGATRSGTNKFVGSIYEFILFNWAFGTYETSNVSNYLMAKYGITVPA